MICPTCSRFIPRTKTRCTPCAVEYARGIDTDRVLYQDVVGTEEAEETKAMKHKHVGKPDEACPGCFEEANLDSKLMIARQRRNTVLGLSILIVGIVVAMFALSRYLAGHGSHLG